MKYLAFDIGCIECGEESNVIGLYPTKKEAEQAIVDYLDGGTHWGKTGWIGQHSCEVFELRSMNPLPVTR